MGNVYKRKEGEPFICAVCGRTDTRPPGSKRTTCVGTCSTKLSSKRRKDRHAKKQAATGADVIIGKCPVCGKTVTTLTYSGRCSYTCRRIDQRRKAAAKRREEMFSSFSDRCPWESGQITGDCRFAGFDRGF